MDEKDLQALEGLLDKKLDQKLRPIKETLDSHTKLLKSHTEILNTHTEILNTHTETLATHTLSLLNLERDIKSYMDALDIERKRIDKSDERVKVIEDSLGVTP